MIEKEMLSVPLLDLKGQYAAIREEVKAAINRVVESQHFILGPEVEALEREVAVYSRCLHGVGVSSGTDALLVSLMALGIKAGDEVITSTYSFFATAGCVARLGARPVFVDVEPETCNIDSPQIEAVITSRTRAIIPVHLYGQMAGMDQLMEIARQHHLYVIEDAAQALGAEDNGRRAGSIGDLGCLSFFPSKNLGAYGDGGGVVTNDTELADRVQLLRNHGYKPKYYNKVVGGNFRLDAIQAAVLRVKLKYLDEWIAARQQAAANYRRLFAEANLLAEDELNSTSLGQHGVRLLSETPGGRHVYNYFIILVPRRDELQAFLKERQIGTEIYYPVPLHLQECFADLGYREGDFPHSENIARRTLALPMYPELNIQQQQSVVEAIKEFFHES